MAEFDEEAILLRPYAWGRAQYLFGRAYAYGLAAAGEAGVTRALEIFRDDLERTLRLLGCESVCELNPSFVSEVHFGLRPQLRSFQVVE